LPPDPVFFTDRNLGAEYLPAELRAAGFRLVTHDEHFAKRQDVEDPEVIAECGRQGWYLLTGDGDLTRRWAREIRAAGIGVFCQTNNHQGPRLWVPRIVVAKPKILRAINKWERPFVGFITAEKKPKLNRAKFTPPPIVG
jgi:uncharacterized protein with PIN domain